MTDNEIQRYVDVIEAAVPRDGADVIFNLEYEEQGCELIANRAGYLRLAAEMLKAAVARLEPGASFTPINLDYLIRGRSMTFKRLVRQEDVESALPPRPAARTLLKDRVAIGGCLLLLAFLVICTMVGLFVVIGRVFR
jgi:hypothetical protein